MARAARLPDVMTPSHASTPAAGDPLLAAQAPLQRGDFAGAAALIESLLAATPTDPRGWGLLGRCRRLLGELGAAETALQRALALAPGFVAARRELAELRAAQGRRDEAAALLDALCREHPTDPGLWWERALLEANHAPAEALRAVQRLRALRPADQAPALLEARLLTTLGRAHEAAPLVDALLATAPDRAETIEAAYWIDVALERPARLARAARLVDLAPSAGRWLRLGQEQALAGDFAAAHAAIAEAQRLEPDLLAARWAAFQLPPSPAPADDAAVAAFARRWSDGLAGFEALDFGHPGIAAQALDCVGLSTAFYRHYLSDDVAAEQRRYGALLQRMLAPLAVAPTRRPQPQARRIAVVSAHLREHTVARLFGPLIERLPAAGFELQVFALEAPSPQWAQRLSAAGAVLHIGPRTLSGWRDAIVATAPDLLLYPELGMDAATLALAALRLAPVQAALWGHPVTSGLASVDWMLSPQAMEPAGSERDYSERLLRLPGLGHGLERAALPVPAPFVLSAAGPDTIDLLCAQTVFKLLPQQDVLFGRILAARPEARLHLLADHRPAVRDWLRARMSPILRAAGADPDRQLLIHGFLPLPQFLGLAGACRLNLDSIGWSGGMSSLDLLAQGLPTLTLPGPTMRSRQTASLLERLELPELIAGDADDYVTRALALIDHPARLAALRDTLRARSDRLFAEPATFDALVRFLAEVEPA